MTSPEEIHTSGFVKMSLEFLICLEFPSCSLRMSLWPSVVSSTSLYRDDTITNPPGDNYLF